MSVRRTYHKRRCRTCSNNNEVSSFQSLSTYLKEYKKTWADLLLFICRIDDNLIPVELPGEMCEYCTEQLKNAYNFVLQVKKNTDDMLSQSLAFQDGKNNNKESDCLRENPVHFINNAVECAKLKLDVNDDDDDYVDNILPNQLKYPVVNKEQKGSSNEEFACNLVDKARISNSENDPIMIFEKHRKLQNLENSKKMNKSVDNRSKSHKSERDKQPATANEDCLRLSIAHQQTNDFQCDLCDKAFKDARGLNQHKKRHFDDIKCRCPLCDNILGDKNGMKRHIMKMHPDETAFIFYKNSWPILNIIKVTGVDKNRCKPNGSKINQCMVCLSTFTSISKLKNHLINHRSSAIDFTQHKMPIEKISQLLYPNEPVMNEEMLTEHINKDIARQQYENLYSITNEAGYELSIISSETERDSESDDVAMENKAEKIKRIYSCELCLKSFNRKYQVFEHHRTAHDWHLAPHYCEHCGDRFLSVELLTFHHLTQCKNTWKRYFCTKCPQRFKWQTNFKKHLDKAHPKVIKDIKKLKSKGVRKFKCKNCSQSFQFLKDWVSHKKMHREDGDLTKCFWCGQEFARLDRLYNHIQQHGIAHESIETVKCILKATNKQNGPKEIMCKVCCRQFSCIGALRSHLLQLHKQNANSNHCYSIMNSLGFELHIDDSDTNDEFPKQCHYTCEICNLKCKRKYELANHQHVMHKPEIVLLKCDKCVFKTVSQDILKHHRDTQCYNLEKKFECDKCFFKFMWEDNLRVHKEQLHKINEPLEKTTANIYKCDKCYRRYEFKNSLKQHMKSVHSEHTNKKTLCTICGKCIAVSSIKIHMRRHTGEKPFKCDVCEKKFVSSADLKTHFKFHLDEKPYKCTVCVKSYRIFSHLNKHMRSHTGEKPYKCTYCGKGFQGSNELNIHTRLHTGERPYACGRVCGKRFITQSLLTNHRKKFSHYEDE